MQDLCDPARRYLRLRMSRTNRQGSVDGRLGAVWLVPRTARNSATCSLPNTAHNCAQTLFLHWASQVAWPGDIQYSGHILMQLFEDGRLSPTLMLVSPSLDFLLFMKHMLETDGFAVVLAKDPDEVVERAEMIKPQAVIAECRASSTMCRDLCTRLKTAQSTRAIAFIPLIEQGAEALYLEMIQAGADRPFHRPFEPIKLLEYLRTLSADGQRSDQQGILKSGGIELNVRTRRVQRDGRIVQLGALEFNLLQIFLQSPGRVFRREELIALGWPANTFVDDRTVDVRIGLLRKSLRANGGTDVIRTVRGIGYAFDAEQD